MYLSVFSYFTVVYRTKYSVGHRESDSDHNTACPKELMENG